MHPPSGHGQLPIRALTCILCRIPDKLLLMNSIFRYFSLSGSILLAVVGLGWLYGNGKRGADLSSAHSIVAQPADNSYNSLTIPQLDVQTLMSNWGIPCELRWEENAASDYNTDCTCNITGAFDDPSAKHIPASFAHSRRPQAAIAAFQELLDAPPARSRLKSLGEFTLTAYTIEYPSTGKRPGAPDFGITFSGSRASLERTVAVDPTVIPIGTPVYIEGIGWRLAEDIGGAVKGKHIDVLLGTEASATLFGVKHHVAVYTTDGVP